MDLHLYSIMALNEDHLEEICQDVRRQIEDGVATCPLFMFKLVPEGNPVVDKVGPLCKTFRAFQQRLKEMGLPCGVLVQCTIGHGWTLSELFPYQAFTPLDDGLPRHIVCPYDEDFRAYIKNCFREIAACHPDMIMLDDDFRLLSFRSGGGCGCPLHVGAFNRLAGTTFTREEVNAAVHMAGPEGDKYNRIMVRVQTESLIDCAKMMREGIDEVDDTIPGSFCCVGNNVESATEIAHILAGRGNPTVVRINNGNYTAAGTRFFSMQFFRAAQSFAKLKGKIDVVLAETDTCPQNRYSTSATALHTHFTGSILEGAMGAKHWITRLGTFEPNSGLEYRKYLARYSGYYKTLADVVPHLTWRGCRIPMTKEPFFDYRRTSATGNGWVFNVLERLGLPTYFSAEPGGITCMSGNVSLDFTDEEIAETLKKPVFLSAESAETLISRGFGDKLGVDVKPWEGEQPSYEYLPLTKNGVGIQVRIKELVPRSSDVTTWSTVFHGVDGAQQTPLFPGVTSYRNADGGTAFVFCGSAEFKYTLTEAFSFLNESRKQQLIAMMQSVGELPLYYPGDAEVYFRAADTDDGRRFCAVFNLGFDPIEDLPLVCDKPVSSITRLTPDGQWENVSFAQNDGRLTLDLTCQTLLPEMLMLQ